MNLAIQTDHLSRGFGSLQAVDGVSLEVPRGVVFGFLGPNGSGKTTTIRLLLGLLEPSSGRAEVLGYDTRTSADQIRAGSGALLEHDGLYERLSAEDNLELAGRIWRMPTGDRRERIREMLSSIGLWDRRREQVGSWSRGMKRKLAVARSLLHRPSLVFLDEPTAGLDPVAAAALRDDLASLVMQDGVTVFLTTHNLSEAEKLCHLVGVISKGRLIAHGPPDVLRARAGRTTVEIIGRGFGEATVSQLRGRPEVGQVSLQGDRLIVELLGDAATAPLVSLIVRSGGEVEEVRKASLEDAFLRLVEDASVE